MLQPHAAAACAPPLAAGLAELLQAYLPQDCEGLAVAGCDGRGRLCAFADQRGDRWQTDSVMPALRRVLACLDVAYVVMAHNHVAGPACPSEMDRITTNRVATFVRLGGASLVDHLIFAGDDMLSMAAIGMV